MESISNEGMCRCCASEGTFKDFLTSYHWMGEEEIYADMLRDCFAITLYTSDDVNNGGICEVCITQLRNACNFKRQVQQTEEQFKKRVQNSGLKSNVIKLEMAGGDDGEHSDTNLSDEFSAAEFEVPIKEEKDEEKPKKRQAAKPSTSRAKKAKTEDGEPSAKRDLLDEKKTVIKLTSRHPKEAINVRRGKMIRITLQKDLKMKETISLITEAEKHQNNIKEILLNSNATPIRCRGGIGYACCFCTEQYPDPADLKRHTIDDHSVTDKASFMKGKDMHSYFVKLDITDLSCKLCDQTIDNITALVKHLQINHDKMLYTDIKDHILPFKFATETLRCFICCNFFNTFKALQEHMNVHYRNYLCAVCGAGFVNKNILLRHGDAHKIGTFNCEECCRTFDTARKKLLHDRSYHSGMKLPHKCGYCLERFKEVWKKYEHLSKVHGIKSPGIKCQVCDKSFETKNAWRLHTTRVHLLQRPHKCSDCDMEFYAKRELESHMVKHTGTREFKCDICFKSYGRQKTLKQHIKRVHS
ncbi:zinc finger and BTB domain-containing protein 41-like isoform X10 [Nymphalis io]|uniref:zinc finger and BTB domain-containing protein 41-like isoform X10 n=1 Tax=Inachis io TaxID=171585 RepID=UPI002169FF41|nr:zinc finger and BTB domain-containing protein 41-like isoform X10 [Nymphalis io]